MIVGVPKEVKPGEARVAMMPAGVQALTSCGYPVLVEAGAGLGSGASDLQYEEHGASILTSAEEIWRRADLIVKVKEPQERELAHSHPGQAIFTYFHLGGDEELTKRVLDAAVVAIAYETVTDNLGDLPLLRPMSQIAGVMSIQEGAKYLERPAGGSGKLLGRIPGVRPAKVVVIGGGTVGSAAARRAAAFGAHVILLEIEQSRLYHLAHDLPAVTTIASTHSAIQEALEEADLLIGAVLIPGAPAPKVVFRKDLRAMTPGGVVVDVAIDQGGCIETSQPTTHANPIRLVDGIVHYGVTNMPGAVPVTASAALAAATLPYVLTLSRHGIERGVREDRHLASGVNAWCGSLTNQAVAAAFNLEYCELLDLVDRCPIGIGC